MWRKQLLRGVFFLVLALLVGLTTPFVTAQTPTGTLTPTATSTPQVVYVHTATVVERGNLRSGPGTSFADVGDVEIGDTLTFMDDPDNPGEPLVETDSANREWAGLVTEDDSEVWVWLDLIGGREKISSEQKFMVLRTEAPDETGEFAIVELDAATLAEINAALVRWGNEGSSITPVQQYNSNLLVASTEAFNNAYPELPVNLLLKSERLMDDFKSSIVRQVAWRVDGVTPAYEEVDRDLNENGENSQYLQRYGNTRLGVRSLSEFAANEDVGPTQTITLRELYTQPILFLQVARDNYPGGDQRTPNGRLTITNGGQIVYLSFTPNPASNTSISVLTNEIKMGMYDQYSTMFFHTFLDLNINGNNLFPPPESEEALGIQRFLLSGGEGNTIDNFIK